MDQQWGGKWQLDSAAWVASGRSMLRLREGQQRDWHSSMWVGSWCNILTVDPTDQLILNSHITGTG
jgi:hypothetical protein